MKKNLYYRNVFKRTNQFKENFLAFFLAFCSWPRLLLEVFVRRNMGERYFSFSTAVFLTVVLAMLPLIISSILDRVIPDFGFSYFLLMFGSWYLFLTAFMYMCIKRREEIERLPSVFDFARFSLSTGQIHPRFKTFSWMGRVGDIRTIETVLEPAFFFIVGFALWMLSQYIGLIIMLCSVFYTLSYRAAYRIGDHLIMDRIDEMIVNKAMVNLFIDNASSDSARGVTLYGNLPKDPEMRKQLMDSFLEEDGVAEAL